MEKKETRSTTEHQAMVSTLSRVRNLCYQHSISGAEVMRETGYKNIHRLLNGEISYVTRTNEDLLNMWLEDFKDTPPSAQYELPVTIGQCAGCTAKSHELASSIAENQNLMQELEAVRVELADARRKIDKLIGAL